MIQLTENYMYLSTTSTMKQDPGSKKWTVAVKSLKGNGMMITFNHVCSDKHYNCVEDFVRDLHHKDEHICLLKERIEKLTAESDSTIQLLKKNNHMLAAKLKQQTLTAMGSESTSSPFASKCIVWCS